MMEESKQQSEEGSGAKIRVRKRIRIKKKRDPKKKIKKIVRIIVWIVVVVGFVATLVMLFSEADISYEKNKKSKGKIERMNTFPILPNF